MASNLLFSNSSRTELPNVELEPNRTPGVELEQSRAELNYRTFHTNGVKKCHPRSLWDTIAQPVNSYVCKIPLYFSFFFIQNCDKYRYLFKKSSHLVLRLREPEVAVEDSLVGEAVVGGHLDCRVENKILSLNVYILVSLADAGGGLK